MSATERMTTTVTRARGWKCGRCWKVLPEVGLCPDHPALCLRCVAVVGPENPADILAWASARFERLYGEARGRGLSKPEAIAWASDVNLSGPPAP
jgi:hypothetical protein